MSDAPLITIELPPEAMQELIEAVVARVLAELEPSSSEYVTPAEAADLLRCGRQRIYDLTSAGRLSRYAEGGRTLLRREEVRGLVACDRRRR